MRWLPKLAFIGWMLYAQVQGGVRRYQRSMDASERPPLYGIHAVEAYFANGQERAPLLTDATRWSHLCIEWPGMASVRTLDGEVVRCKIVFDEQELAFELTPPGDSEAVPQEWTYERPESDALILRGTWRGEELEVHTREVDPRSFLLVKRWFSLDQRASVQQVGAAREVGLREFGGGATWATLGR